VILEIGHFRVFTLPVKELDATFATTTKTFYVDVVAIYTELDSGTAVQLRC